MKMFYKSKHKIVLMVIMALVFQIVGPVVGDYAYASGGEEAFTFEVVTQPDGSGRFQWTYNPNIAEGQRDFEIDLGLELMDNFPGELYDREADVTIGEFTISKDGILKATIYEIEVEETKDPEGSESTEEPDLPEVLAEMVEVQGNKVVIELEVEESLEGQTAKVEILKEDGNVVDKVEVGVEENWVRTEFENLEPGNYLARVTVGEDKVAEEEFEIEEVVVEDDEDDEAGEGSIDPGEVEELEESGDADETQEDDETETEQFPEDPEDVEEASIFGEEIAALAYGSDSLDGMIVSETEEVEKEASGGGFIPFSFFMDSDEKDLGNIFTDVKLMLNDVEIEGDTTIGIDENTTIRIVLDWELADSVELKDGDWSKIKLPELLKSINEGGELKDGIDVIGEFTFEDGFLKVVFNNKLNELGKVTNRHGQVGFLMKFNLTEFEDDARQIIQFEGITNTVTITAKPKGDNIKEIAKSGKPDADINPQNINWVIDVNTTLDDLKNAKVTDIIPEGLELNKESIEVFELTVGHEGELTKGNKVDNPNIDTIEDRKFVVDLGDTDKAYRIEYSTKIVDYPEDGYNNKAILTAEDKANKEAEFKIDRITKGSLIEKTGWADNNKNATKVFWQIDINKAEEDLKGVTVEDQIPAGLNINNIKIYELNKSGDGWIQGTDAVTMRNEISENFLKIDFGDIEGKAYRIIVETDIVYGEVYEKDITFENEAILKENNTEQGHDNAEVKVTRDTLLEKSGYESTSYGKPEITWTIHVNKANHIINNATITDTIGDGLELRKGSIEVNGQVVPVVQEGSNYPYLEEQKDNKFILKLGDITTSQTITYITDITNPDKESFGNRVELKGDGLTGNGIGDGGTITKEPSVTPSINNYYAKERAASNKEIDGIVYDGLNYKEKTMSWVITVDAIKEKIIELKITDTFGIKSNNEFEQKKIMKFLIGSLKIEKAMDNTTTLVESSEYDLTDKGVEGFELKFTNELDRAKYEIYFKTSFDPDQIIAAGGTLNAITTYENKVKFDGKTEDVNEGVGTIDTSDNAEYTIKEVIFNGGKKDGSLDRDNRTITWKIYANALGRDLSNQEFKIVDTLGEEQVFNEKPFNVYEYSLDGKGNIVEGEEITEEFVLVPTEGGSGFTLTFANGISTPVMVIYTTSIKGISEEVYTNKADVTGKDLNKTYNGEVTYNKHDKFVDKNSDVGSQAYTDDEIQWTVKLNESLSEIDNAIFRDTISAGQILVNDSVKVYKGDISEGDISEENLVTIAKEDIDISTEVEGETELEIKLGKIDSIYTISYITVVTAKEGEISNEASLWGDEDQLGESSDKEYDSSQASWGTGTGDRPNRGQIEIIKIDAETGETIANNSAKFELYYYLNDEERIVNGEAQETEIDGDNAGKVGWGNLPYRTYYLREVKAPEGYELSGEIIEIEVTQPATTKVYKENISNKKIEQSKIEITGTKVWVDGPTPRPTIELQLFRNGEKLGSPVELKDGDTKHTWEKLEYADENGKKYTYTVDEVKTPTDYGRSRSEDKLTVINTYKSPKTEVTGRKVWIGGPSRKPTIELQLYRDGEALDNPIELKDGETEYTWTNLDRTDINGKEYTYTIDEVRTPRYYRKSISSDGLTITNRYSPPVYPPGPGPGPDPTDPVDPEEPTDPEEPEEPTDPEETPDPEEPEEPTDPEETPDPEEPEEPTIPIVLDPPTKGTITFDEDGNWIYNPEPGATGKDTFTIVHPDGREETITINLDDVPLGTTEITKETLTKLPKTGAVSNLGFYLAGLSLIFLGVFLRKRKTV